MSCTLPYLPSELIRVALADLAKVEADPVHYTVSMGVWHATEGRALANWLRPHCLVCFAGAVMAGTCGVPPSRSAVPENDTFMPWDRNRLFALNAFRQGAVGVGLRFMFAPWQVAAAHKAGAPVVARIPWYEKDPVAWRAAMVNLADTLQAAGW